MWPSGHYGFETWQGFIDETLLKIDPAAQMDIFNVLLILSKNSAIDYQLTLAQFDCFLKALSPRRSYATKRDFRLVHPLRGKRRKRLTWQRLISVSTSVTT